MRHAPLWPAPTLRKDESVFVTCLVCSFSPVTVLSHRSRAVRIEFPMALLHDVLVKSACTTSQLSRHQRTPRRFLIGGVTRGFTASGCAYCCMSWSHLHQPARLYSWHSKAMNAKDGDADSWFR